MLSIQSPSQFQHPQEETMHHKESNQEKVLQFDNFNLVLGSIEYPSVSVCLFENTNFLGGGLPESDGGQGIETADVDECDRECKKRDKCNYFTFVGEWKINCYLKARLGENSEFDGATSGTYGQLCGKIIFFHCCSANL